MKTEFTPGPWKPDFHSGESTFHGKFNFFYIQDCESKSITSDRSMQELVANAYLIQAAPEMLSVLKTISDELSVLHHSLDTLENSDSRKVKILDLKRTIEKTIELATKI